jgi:hypothetical protein
MLDSCELSDRELRQLASRCEIETDTDELLLISKRVEYRLWSLIAV